MGHACTYCTPCLMNLSATVHKRAKKKADANPFRCRYAAAGEQINY